MGRPQRPDETFGHDRSAATKTFVAIDPRSASLWIAEFNSAEPLHRSLTGIFGTPRPRQMCLVAHGTPFVGDVHDRRFETLVTGESVTDVVEDTTNGLVLLASRWSVSAWNGAQVVWATARISIEDLRLDEIRTGRLHGVADPDDEARDFCIDLASGRLDL